MSTLLGRLRGRLGLPEAPLRRLQWLFAGFAAVNAAFAGANAVLSTGLAGDRRAAAVGAAAILAALFVAAYRERRFRLRLVPLELAALLVLSLVAGPQAALGVFFVGLYARALHDEPPRVALATAGYVAVFAAALALDGAPAPVSMVVGVSIGLVLSAAVMSVAARSLRGRELLERRLAHQAAHDPLTGLPNREQLRRRLERALLRRACGGETFSVLFLDLDDFKLVNDSLGHDAGDRLLVEVARRLRANSRPEDLPVRMGGDEFSLLLHGNDDPAGLAASAERLVNALAQPYDLDGRVVTVGASVGIAVPTDLTSAEELLREADVAMYAAKHRGKGRYEFFDAALHDVAVEQLELRADLATAVDHGELVLHYQPIVEVATGRVCGVEALLRWQHPLRGLIAPAGFIPLAEESGLIVPIGRWVLFTACAQAAEWQRAQAPGEPPLNISVNVSLRQLSDPALPADVARALAGSGLAPGTLILELTESALLQDPATAAARLATIGEQGVRVAIDDFGSGYTSLTYLRDLPVDLIKVDRSFVERLTGDDGAPVLTEAIVGMARTLGVGAVAEGVETGDQLAALRAMSCDFGQGFYLERPLPAQELGAALHAGAVRPTSRAPTPD